MCGAVYASDALRDAWWLRRKQLDATSPISVEERKLINGVRDWWDEMADPVKLSFIYVMVPWTTHPNRTNTLASKPRSMTCSAGISTLVVSIVSSSKFGPHVRSTYPEPNALDSKGSVATEEDCSTEDTLF